MAAGKGVNAMKGSNPSSMLDKAANFIGESYKAASAVVIDFFTSIKKK